MKTKSFLEKILPSQGNYLLTDITNKPGRHYKYDSIDKMAFAAVALSSKGRNIFHANCTFKNARRIQADAIWAKALWLDIDIDPEPGRLKEKKTYLDRDTAAKAVTEGIKQMGMPAPMIVMSGGGFHMYWPFTEDCPIDTWQEVASIFKKALKLSGIKFDPVVPADSARILRPVGTVNPKHNKEVRLIRDCDPFEVAHLMSLLKKYVESIEGVSDEIDLSQVKSSKRFDTTADLTTHATIKPSAKIIVEKCVALASLVANPADVSEPEWRGMIGIGKHCVEGNELIHEWSKGHPGYSAGETNAKIEQYQAAPTTCEYFDQFYLCNGCRYKSAKMKSPIALGVEQVESQTPATKTGRTKRELPFPFGWDAKENVLYRKYKEDGEIKRRPVTESFVHAKTRIRTSDGTWALLCERLVYQDPDNPSQSQWEEFEVPTKYIGKASELIGVLGSYEVYPMTKTAGFDIGDLFRNYGNSLRYDQQETITYDNFGFDGQRFDQAATASRFVLGTTAITEDGEEDARCGPDVHKSWNTDFGTSGSIDEWVRLTDAIYNRRGGEVFQFGILTAFAAPMVALATREDWHGIPVVYVGTSGKGKSTVCAVACSMYGKPSLFEIKANKSGSTANALFQRLATANNLPLIFDEASDMEIEQTCDLMYGVSNGTEKLRLDSTGGPKQTNRLWDTMVFATSNKSLLEQVSRAQQQGVQDATMVRMFEIRLDDYTLPEFYTEDAMYLLRYEMPKQYGLVGRKWLRFIMKFRNEIEAQVIKEERKLGSHIDITDTAERFQIRAIATILAAGRITKKLGFHNFDLLAIRDFALANMQRLREVRNTTKQKSVDLISMYLSAFHDRIINTRLFPKRRSRDTEQVFNVRGEIVGRIAHEDQKVYISAHHFTGWLQDRGISALAVLQDLHKTNMLLVNKNLKPNPSTRDFQCNMTLGKGTNITTGQTWCIEFNYTGLSLGGAALTTVGAANESDQSNSSV